MAKSVIKKSTRINRAQDRLAKAIDGLEEAVRQRSNGGTGPDPELKAELDALRAENERLKSLNSTVSERLDTAIGRMKTVLEG